MRASDQSVIWRNGSITTEAFEKLIGKIGATTCSSLKMRNFKVVGRILTYLLHRDLSKCLADNHSVADG